MTKISVIIPCYYSEKTITDVVEETIREFEKMNNYAYEFILVNDGSDDSTFDRICALAEKYPFVTGVDLAKNCGQHNAIIAGMKLAKGEYILGMDDDFQTHPSQIFKLTDKLEEGYDVVYGKFPHRHHSLIRNLESKLSELSARFLIDNPKDIKACPMYIIRRFVRDEIIKSHSSYTNLRGLFLRTTSRIANAEIEHFDRKSGKSGYTFKKLMRLWSSYLNYSAKPVKLIRKFGLLIFFAGLIYLISSLILQIPTVNIIASEIAVFAGVIIFILGLLGEYLVRLFMVATNEPQYVIRSIIRVSDNE
ncbi:MAG: glycosyltransferase family 2 protein [Ruminococcus sp.]